MTETAIYSLSHPSTTLPKGAVTDRKALCLDCLEYRLTRGWCLLGKESAPFKLGCQDCTAKEQAAR